MKTILGLGSLLSEESARNTCPSLQNFRLGTLNGYRRVFAKVDADCASNDECEELFPHIACWGAEKNKLNNLIVSIFEIPDDEWEPFVIREFDYKLQKITVNSKGKKITGILCVNHQSQQEFLKHLENKPLKESCFKEIHSLHNGDVWGRIDILPETQYLQRCLNVAKALGVDILNNVLDHSYTADRKTTIREYVKQNSTLFSL